MLKTLLIFPETERDARLQEIGDLCILSMICCYPDQEFIKICVGTRYAKRVQEGKNYYNVKPFHIPKEFTFAIKDRFIELPLLSNK